MKGVPIRIEIGPHEMQKGEVTFVARDCTGERVTAENGEVVSTVKEMMEAVHSRLLEK